MYKKVKTKTTNQKNSRGIALGVLELEDVNKICDIFKNNFSEIWQVDLDYNKDYLERLDNYIEDIRLTEEIIPFSYIKLMISYTVGRCLISEFGGNWFKKDKNNLTAPGINISKNIQVFPFTKVNKQFKNGSEDSILGLSIAIQSMLRMNF